MKISEITKGLYDDLKLYPENELVSITFSGITWKIEIKSLIKIFEYADKYFESKSK